MIADAVDIHMGLRALVNDLEDVEGWPDLNGKIDPLLLLFDVFSILNLSDDDIRMLLPASARSYITNIIGTPLNRINRVQ